MFDKSSRIIPARWNHVDVHDREVFKCEKHSHNGIQHSACFNRENGITERKAIIDIETGGLDAGFDIVLCWVIRDVQDPTKVISDHVTVKDLESGVADRRILKHLCEVVWQYDRLIGHYSGPWRFDLPFLRTRCIRLGLEFPTQGMMWISDTYPMAKKLLRLTSYRQNSIARAILGKDEKTNIDAEYWRNIKYGTKKQRTTAIDYIMDHCEHDTMQCLDIYNAMIPFVKEAKTSI